MTTRQRRRRLGHRHGRPRSATARRRATTVAGRRAPDDLGTAELRRAKVRATLRDNLEINAVGILHGRGVIDTEQYNQLTLLTLWIERLMRGWSGVGGVTGLWHSIVGASIPTGYVRIQNDAVSGLADQARQQLARALQQLDGSKSLVIALAENQASPIVLRTIEGRLTQADQVELERLRISLDRLAGRRTRQAHNNI